MSRTRTLCQRHRQIVLELKEHGINSVVRQQLEQLLIDIKNAGQTTSQPDNRDRLQKLLNYWATDFSRVGDVTLPLTLTPYHYPQF